MPYCSSLVASPRPRAGGLFQCTFNDFLHREVAQQWHSVAGTTRRAPQMHRCRGISPLSLSLSLFASLLLIILHCNAGLSGGEGREGDCPCIVTLLRTTKSGSRIPWALTGACVTEVENLFNSHVYTFLLQFSMSIRTM